MGQKRKRTRSQGTRTRHQQQHRERSIAVIILLVGRISSARAGTQKAEIRLWVGQSISVCRRSLPLKVLRSVVRWCRTMPHNNAHYLPSKSVTALACICDSRNILVKKEGTCGCNFMCADLWLLASCIWLRRVEVDPECVCLWKGSVCTAVSRWVRSGSVALSCTHQRQQSTSI